MTWVIPGTGLREVGRRYSYSPFLCHVYPLKVSLVRGENVTEGIGAVPE